MKKINKFIIILLGAVSLFILGDYVVEFIEKGRVSFSAVTVLLLLFFGWMEIFTWGHDKQAAKDEMGKQIAMKSAKISYYLVISGLFLLWIIDRIVFVRSNEFGNISLLIGLCLALMIHPIVQFFLTRKYH
jgi:hypothetical protein